MHPGRPVPAGLRLPPAPEVARSPRRSAGATPGQIPGSGPAARKMGRRREAPAQSGGNDARTGFPNRP